jgi:predicted TIM-barrel fold metal-dependent hydrolase
MTYCIEQFGPNRCMFESNFPVDSAAERAAMCPDTAARV